MSGFAPAQAPAPAPLADSFDAVTEIRALHAAVQQLESAVAQLTRDYYALQSQVLAVKAKASKP